MIGVAKGTSVADVMKSSPRTIPKRKYTINQKNYLLVEFADFAIPPSMDDTLHELHLAGLSPIITHPERNARALSLTRCLTGCHSLLRCWSLRLIDDSSIAYGGPFLTLV